MWELFELFNGLHPFRIFHTVPYLGPSFLSYLLPLFSSPCYLALFFFSCAVLSPFLIEKIEDVYKRSVVFLFKKYFHHRVCRFALHNFMLIRSFRHLLPITNLICHYTQITDFIATAFKLIENVVEKSAGDYSLQSCKGQILYGPAFETLI